jgi:cysteamine dioxygenase
MDDYTRREFVRTSLPGYLGLVMALPGITALASRANAQQGHPDAAGRINWDAFLEGVAKQAARQHLDDWNEAEYVMRAEAIAQQLNLEDPILLAAFKKARKGIGNGRVDFDRLEQREDFQISYLQFEKGEQIRHHNHPNMTGVLLCATGELVSENYDVLDEPTRKGHVLLKSSGTSVLKKGLSAGLTSKQRNIHRVEARALSQIVDVFAPPYTRDRIENSTWYTPDDEPFNGRAGIYEARVG